jgi:hypothetical protein
MGTAGKTVAAMLGETVSLAGEMLNTGQIDFFS